jgi:peptidoglycan-associated lipoprotein
MMKMNAQVKKNKEQFIKLLSIGMCALVLAACATTSGSNANDGSASIGATGDDAKTLTTGLGSDANLAGANLSDKSKMQVGNQVYYFDFDKSEVYATDRPSIEVQGNYLIAHPKAKIVLEGNTDPRGSREYNIALGERRAQAVADILKLQGVKPEQMRIVSYGAEKASGEETEEAYAKDRHVDLVYESK